MTINDRFTRLSTALAHCPKAADRKLPADLEELAALRDHATPRPWFKPPRPDAPPATTPPGTASGWP